MYLLNHTIEIMFPEECWKLTDEETDLLFPGRQRPQEVVKVADEAYMVFCLTDKAVDDSQLDSAINEFYFMIRQRCPENIFLDRGSMQVTPGHLSWMDFKGDAFSGETYYLLFLTRLGGKLLMGLFQCGWKQMRIYRSRILHILSGIRDLSEMNTK